ncbi:hypothetical protein BDV93DRAFT_513045 [Ceratobasidium sp. AG-I]|nr:hypothetical protein BDV93DRAFT_513045 [Ceratobasidium sp. AG-I]
MFSPRRIPGERSNQGVSSAYDKITRKASTPADDLGDGTVKESETVEESQAIEDAPESVDEENNHKAAPKKGVKVLTPPLSSPSIEQRAKAPPTHSSSKAASTSRAHESVPSSRAKGKLKRAPLESGGEVDDDDGRSEFNKNEWWDGAEDRNALEDVKREEASETAQRPSADHYHTFGCWPIFSNHWTLRVFTIGGFSGMYSPSAPKIDVRKKPVHWVGHGGTDILPSVIAKRPNVPRRFSSNRTISLKWGS